MPRDIQTIFAELQAAIVAQTDVRENNSRVISRTAKTVMPGMWVEFPLYGWRECTGTSRIDGQTLLSDGGSCFWTIGSNERVRTRRADASVL